MTFIKKKKKYNLRSGFVILIWMSKLTVLPRMILDFYQLVNLLVQKEGKALVAD
jgi:hypothetical protein